MGLQLRGCGHGRVLPQRLLGRLVGRRQLRDQLGLGQNRVHLRSDRTVDRGYVHKLQHGATAPANYSADYDPNGNRTSATGGDGTSTTAESEASSTNRLLFDGTYYYAYDAEGNRVAQYKITSGTDTSLGTQASPNSEASDITVYTWNNANEMTSATHYNTAADWTAGTYSYVGEYAVNYAYDALGEMVTRNATLGEFYPIGGGGDDDYTEDLTLGTTTENFIYDGQNIVLVMASNGQVIDRNLTGPAADQVFATEEVVAVLSGPQAAGTVNWLLTDNQGTVRDVVQYGSGVVDHLVYGAFGQLVSQSASSAGDQPIFFYDGTWQDPITGLNKMGARWYDALDAVFDSYDPDSFGGGQTNLMEYCGNSPTNATDPSGTSSLWGNGYDSNGNFIGFGSPEIEPVNAANENRSLIGASGQVGWEKQQFQPSFNDPLSRGAFTYSQSCAQGDSLLWAAYVGFGVFLGDIVGVTDVYIAATGGDPVTLEKYTVTGRVLLGAGGRKTGLGGTADRRCGRGRGWNFGSGRGGGTGCSGVPC